MTLADKIAYGLPVTRSESIVAWMATARRPLREYLPEFSPRTVLSEVAKHNDISIVVASAGDGEFLSIR